MVGKDSKHSQQLVGAAARLGGLPDLPAILQGIAEAALTALGADRATCHAHCVDDQIVTAVFTTETRPEHRALLERNIGEVATGLPICRLQVAQDNPVLTIEDVANDPAVPPAVVQRIGSGAVLGVRLEHPSIPTGDGLALLGTLVCIYRLPRQFSMGERQAALGLAGLATLALANARLQHETAERLEENRMLAAEQAALRQVATRVAEAAPEAVFAQAAKEVAGLLGVQCGLVARYEQDHSVPVGWWGADQPAVDAIFPREGGGALAVVARTGRAARVDDYEPLADDPVGKIARAAGYRSAVAAPVRVGGRLWGALLAATTDATPLGSETEGRLQRFAELVALGIANAEAQARLAAQAASDPLTGLANHRAFFQRLHAETQRARRGDHPVSLALIDLDHFKGINDAHGHLTGDGVLVEAAARLSGLARGEDLVARVGGEEFAWLLPDCDVDSAWAAAERARRAIGEEPFAEVGWVTLSAGVAELRPGMSMNELFRAADAALYWAKSQGRNRCVPHSPEHDRAIATYPAGAGRLAPSIDRLLALGREQLGLTVVAVGQFQDGIEVLRHLSGDGEPFGLRAGAAVPLEDTYCQRVVDGSIPPVICDTAREARVRDLDITRTAGIGAYIGVPITLADGSFYGMLCGLSPQPEPHLGEQDLRLMRILAGMLGEELEREERGAYLQRAQQARIHRVLNGEGLSIVFQPIVELAGGEVVAAEALSRFALEPCRSPERWFAEAAAVNLGVELELAAMRAALANLDEVPVGARLSINLSPEALRAPQILELLASVPGDRLAVELTEHTPVVDYAALESALAGPRSRGVQLMIDDAGAGFSSLKHIVGLRPDVIKLDLALTRDIDTDPVRRALAASLVAFAREIDAIIVAEGIETPGELNALRALGVTHGQGYYIAPPSGGRVPERLALHEPTPTAVTTG